MPESKYPVDTSGKVDYVFQSKERLARIDEQRRKETQTEANKMKAFSSGKKQEFLVCPMCRMHFLRMVKTNIAGEPYANSPAPGIQYIRTLKGLERRFVGPTSDYTPLAIRYNAGGRMGSFLNPKESMSPRVLQTVDKELFDHFRYVIEESRKAFTIH
jgi:hypothetical protein